MQAHQIESEIIRKVTLRQQLFGCEAHFLPYLKRKEQKYLGRADFTILSMPPPLLPVPLTETHTHCTNRTFTFSPLKSAAPFKL